MRLNERAKFNEDVANFCETSTLKKFCEEYGTRLRLPGHYNVLNADPLQSKQTLIELSSGSKAVNKANDGLFPCIVKTNSVNFHRIITAVAWQEEDSHNVGLQQ